jgi:hypothetical protein
LKEANASPLSIRATHLRLQVLDKEKNGTGKFRKKIRKERKFEMNHHQRCRGTKSNSSAIEIKFFN